MLNVFVNLILFKHKESMLYVEIPYKVNFKLNRQFLNLQNLNNLKVVDKKQEYAFFLNKKKHMEY